MVLKGQDNLQPQVSVFCKTPYGVINVCLVPKKLCAQRVLRVLGISCILMCTGVPGRQRPSLAILSPTVPRTTPGLSKCSLLSPGVDKDGEDEQDHDSIPQSNSRKRRETRRQTLQKLSKEGFRGQMVAIS